MPTSGYDVIALMAERLVAEGCSPAQVATVEAQLVNMLAKADKARRAAQLLPHLGPVETASRLGCSRSHVYNLLHKFKARPKTAA